MTAKLPRQSNIELLRMVAMFLVLLVHADFFSLGSPTISDIQTDTIDSFFKILFESISIVCVNVFVLISGWFGIKPSYKGILNFLFQCIFFLTGLYIITNIIGVNTLSLKGLAGCVFATKLNWFIKAYLLLYIISPVLNHFVNNTSQKEFKYILFGFFLFTCTYGWIGAAEFMMQGYSTISFIGLYLLARYIRIYSPAWSKLHIKYDIAIYLSTIIIVSALTFTPPLYLGVKIPLNFYSYISPTTIIGAVYLLLAFSKISIQSKFINWCGVSCFAVFLIHVSPSTLWHYKDLFVKLHDSLPTLEYWGATFIILTGIFIIAILIDKVRIAIWEICWNKIFRNIEPVITNIIK
ncbi:MAG: acyltransferase family protein [Alistipes sp.]|nr:acyltransferase family protein [Alistipes sp.]